MAEPIRMSVFKPTGHRYYRAQWRNRDTGKLETRTTKQTVEQKARQVAAGWALAMATNQPEPGRISWDKLCEAYMDDVYPNQALKTQYKTRATMRAVAKFLAPANVGDMTAGDVRLLKKKLRERDLSEWTVRGHMAELRKILKWAKRNNLIRDIPNLEVPTPVPPTVHPPDETSVKEMVKAVAKVVGGDSAPSWEQLIEGLHLSGLRLSEAECIRWAGGPTSLMWVELSGELPMLHVSAAFDKKRKNRIFPMAPDFADWLRKVPESDRTGYVFNPKPWGDSHPTARPSEERMCKTISKIGRAAKVLVSNRKVLVTEAHPDGIKPKHATAHDLRRSFCVRWSQRVLPPVLMEMARHESIQTTMQFYVGRNSQIAARQAWDAYRDGNADRAAG